MDTDGDSDMASAPEARGILEIKAKKKVGVLYLASIPPMMTVTKLREYFNLYSGNKVGRMFLQESEY